MGSVHAGSPDGNDYTLCGLAYEGAGSGDPEEDEVLRRK